MLFIQDRQIVSLSREPEHRHEPRNATAIVWVAYAFENQAESALLPFLPANCATLECLRAPGGRVVSLAAASAWLGADMATSREVRGGAVDAEQTPSQRWRGDNSAGCDAAKRSAHHTGRRVDQGGAVPLHPWRCGLTMQRWCCRRLVGPSR